MVGGSAVILFGVALTTGLIGARRTTPQLAAEKP
jgi:hypothetical protein